MVWMLLLVQALSEYTQSDHNGWFHGSNGYCSLREHSHGKDITYIINTAIEVINFVKSKGIEVRFSSEDSFRSGKILKLPFSREDCSLIKFAQILLISSPSILPLTKSVFTELVLPIPLV